MVRRRHQEGDRHLRRSHITTTFGGGPSLRRTIGAAVSLMRPRAAYDHGFFGSLGPLAHGMAALSLWAVRRRCPSCHSVYRSVLRPASTEGSYPAKERKEKNVPVKAEGDVHPPCKRGKDTSYDIRYFSLCVANWQHFKIFLSPCEVVQRHPVVVGQSYHRRYAWQAFSPFIPPQRRPLHPAQFRYHRHTFHGPL